MATPLPFGFVLLMSTPCGLGVVGVRLGTAEGAMDGWIDGSTVGTRVLIMVGWSVGTPWREKITDHRYAPMHAYADMNMDLLLFYPSQRVSVALSHACMATCEIAISYYYYS